MSPFWNQQSNNHTLRVQTVVQQSMDPNFKYGHAEEKLYVLPRPLLATQAESPELCIGSMRASSMS
jgi:hypothetical protein